MANHMTKRWKLVLIPLLIPFMVSAQMLKPNKYHDGVAMDKGMKFASLTLSASSKDAENENTLLVYYINQKKSGLTVRFDGGYMFKQNLAAGAGFLYSYRKDDNTQKASDGTITDSRTYAREFAFRPFVKSFIPLGQSKKFYVVIPTELQIGYGSKVKEDLTNGILTRTYSETNYYGLQMRPGLLAFIVNNFGFEMNVGAFGLSSSKEKIKTTNQPDGEVKTNDLSLRIDILQLSLGFSLYFK